MPTRGFLPAAAGLAILVLSCAPAPHADLAAAAAQIRALSARWMVADSLRDEQTAVSFYAEDAVEMPSNAPAVHGKTAILAWYQSWLHDPNSRLSFATDSVLVAPGGEMALERGHYRFVTRTPAKETVDTGKYLTVWSKRGDSWLVVADMANSDLPMP